MKNNPVPERKYHDTGEMKNAGKGAPSPAFGQCIVPQEVRHGYKSFIEWCLQHDIREIGHTVAPMTSSLLRAKPVNIKEYDEDLFTNGSELDGSSIATGGGLGSATLQSSGSSRALQ